MSRRSTRSQVPRKRPSPDVEEEAEEDQPKGSTSSQPNAPSPETGTRASRRPRRTSSAPGVSGSIPAAVEGEEPLEQRRASATDFIPTAEASGSFDRKTPEAASDPGGPRLYELSIVQQPEMAMAAGLTLDTLGRLSIQPVPVLQLVERSAEGELLATPPSPTTTRRFFCSCSLVNSEGSGSDGMETPDAEEEAVDFVDPEHGEGRLQALIGQLVCDLKHTVDPDGQPTAYFVFGDVSVRQSGRYRLRFSAFEARAGTTRIASIASEPFEVFDRSDYPGQRGVTELTRHLYDIGDQTRLPALEDTTLLPV